MGRRIEKAVTENSVTVTTRYLYDGLNIIAEYDVNGNITTKYIHGLGIDEPLAMEKNSSTYYYHADGLGSVVALSDSSGAIVQSYEYNSFGNIKSVLDPNFVQPYTFTAREYDPETGMLFYRARTLDSKTGTFTTKDPIGFNAGDVNLYRYVGNNPVNYIDPMGLWRSPWKIYDEASKDAASKFFADELTDGMGDAYRHCVASCEMTREDSSFITTIFGWANEKKGDWLYNQKLGERKMDDFNNAYGRGCGKKAKDLEDCQQQCLTATKNGKLKTYKSSSNDVGYWY